ncbi:MAG: hypothetical protein AB1465_00010 [Patescibacteria group bacterium]
MFINIFVSFANIVVAIFLMFILFFMQGFPLGLIIGGTFIALNFCKSSKKTYSRIIYFIIPLTVLFSINIIMAGAESSVPSYCKIPIPVGLAILSPIWAIILLNLYFSKRICDKSNTNNYYSIWTKIMAISFFIFGIIYLGFGIVSAPFLILMYSKDPVSFWSSIVFIFSGLFKMRVVKNLLKNNLQYMHYTILLIGLLDALIGYVFIPKFIAIINIYLIIYFIISLGYFLKIHPKK